MSSLQYHFKDSKIILYVSWGCQVVKVFYELFCVKLVINILYERMCMHVYIGGGKSKINKNAKTCLEWGLKTVQPHPSLFSEVFFFFFEGEHHYCIEVSTFFKFLTLNWQVHKPSPWWKIINSPALPLSPKLYVVGNPHKF